MNPVSNKFLRIRYLVNPQISNGVKQGGFTLLELMLAITIFSVAAIISVSALFGVLIFQRKASALQRVQNNVNFAVKSMMADISVGDVFYCGSSVPSGPVANISPRSCWSGGGPLIVFRNVRDEKTVYRLDNDAIERCVDVSGSGNCDSGSGSNYLLLTAASVNIDSTISSFYVDGAERAADGDTKQPRIQLVIRATTDVGGEIEVMNIQSTVSQFSPDF